MADKPEGNGRRSMFGHPFFLFGIAALLLPIGAILLVVVLAWQNGDIARIEFWLGAGGVSVLVVLGAGLICLLGWRRLLSHPGARDPRCVARYNRYLVGTGYALLVCATLCGVLVAGLIYSKNLHCTGRDFDALFADTPAASEPARKQPGEAKPQQTPQQPADAPPANAPPTQGIATKGKEAILPTLILISIMASIVGALFFVANSLREKCAVQEPFSAWRFWGGLWFRLGEAVLFSLVMFWLVWRGAEPKNAATPMRYTWLPILSLLMGMFVKSGESLVFAIAQGLFKAVGAFFGLATVPPPKPDETDNGAPPGAAPKSPAAPPSAGPKQPAATAQPVGDTVSVTNVQLSDPNPPSG